MEADLKVAVVGANGFIGASVYEALLKKGVDARPIFTSAKGASLHQDCEWLRLELRGFHTIYLCAGRTGGSGKMAGDPLSFIYPNVRIHMNVYEVCSELGVKRIVGLQSTTGYRNSPEPMVEEDYEGELHPTYFVPGTASRFINSLSKMFKDMEFVYFRPSNVYGPRNNFDPKDSHVIEATVRKVADRQDPFVIWGNGMDARDAVYIDDLAEAMTYGVDCPPGAYNVAPGEEMTVNQIARTLLDHAEFFPMIEHDLSKPSTINVRRVDTSKIRALGWKPTVSMVDGLKKTYDWYVGR